MNNSDQHDGALAVNSTPKKTPAIPGGVAPQPTSSVGLDHYVELSTKRYYFGSATGYTYCDYTTLKECIYPMMRWMLPPPLDGSFAAFIAYVHHYNCIDYAGPLAGFKIGPLVQGDAKLLITSEPKFIDPKPGSCAMLQGIFERMLGMEQLPYFYGWLKLSLQMFRSQVWMAGQVLVLAGPPGAGKTLCGAIIKELFGGRTAGNPYAFMAGKTTFNGGLARCELLAIEDQVSMTSIAARRDFGANIKDFAVNKFRWLHGKFKEGTDVCMLQRLIITLNDLPERLQILPPIEGDIEDKIILFKVEGHPMPMPTRTTDEMNAFKEAWMAELPAFVAYLDQWPIPANLTANRYGIKHYHNSELLKALNELSPEDRLKELIDEVIFGLDPKLPSWKGKALLLDRALKGADSFDVQREARQLLPAANTCGRYLARLAERYPERFSKSSGRGGIFVWEIQRAEDDPVDAGTDAMGGTPLKMTPAETKAFIERIKVGPSKIDSNSSPAT
jgi:hypothetical protein